MQINSTFVINLAKERERKESINKELKNINIDPHFITAFDGHDKNFPFHKYKNLSGNFWRRKHDFKPGAFTCYLSHAECWKETIKKNHISMILEDDVLIDPIEYINFTIDNSIKNFDVIFINKGAINLVNTNKTQKFIPVSDVLKQLVLEINITKKIMGPGTYGYIISVKGAIKLLKMMKTRKISMGVDYAILFNSLKLKDLELLISMSKEALPSPLDFFVETELNHLSHGSLPVALESYIYNPTAIIHIKHFTSNIKHDIFLKNEVFEKQ